MEQDMKKTPEKKFRAGAISITVWKNQSQKGDYRTVQVSRSYKDNSEKWQNTTSLRVQDIPATIVLLNRTYEYLALKEDGPVQASAQ